MDKGSPYRASSSSRAGLAPPLGWTRTATVVLTLLGTIIPAAITYSLFDYRRCPGEPSKSYPQIAVLVVGLCGALLFAGWHAQAWLARWMGHIRVRSAVSGLALSTITLFPVFATNLFATALALGLSVASTPGTPCMVGSDWHGDGDF